MAARRSAPRPVYLDYAATCPVDASAVKAMAFCLEENFGNPACKHTHGRAADAMVDDARRRVAGVIGAKSEEIFFTGGATEADNWALKGPCGILCERGRPHIVTVQTEHKAILETCKRLQDEDGIPVTYLGVDSEGLIDLDELWDAITPETGLVSVMAANNETGVIQDLREVGKICRQRGVTFHVDGAQGFGKMPLDVNYLNIDLLSISGHKIYGPKGAGALYVRGGVDAAIEPEMDGGGQERGFRSGTLNVPAIAGFGKAAEVAYKKRYEDAEHTKAMRDLMHTRLRENLSGVSQTSANAPRLPGHLHVGFAGIHAADLLRSLDGKVSITSGSACAAGCNKPSHVMKAMGHRDPASTVRFTFGRPTTREEVERAAEQVTKAVRTLRK